MSSRDCGNVFAVLGGNNKADAVIEVFFLEKCTWISMPFEDLNEGQFEFEINST